MRAFRRSLSLNGNILSKTIDNHPEIGSFVKVRGSGWGTCKLLNISECGLYAVVGLFVSIAKQLINKTVDIQRISKTELQANTKCYVKDAHGKWFIGLISHLRSGKYSILLPGKTCITIPQYYSKFYVRSANSLIDPTELLIYKGHETAFFHRYRSEFLYSLIKQRKASHGIPGLLSAKIKLFPYQVEVIRRVLEDPFQRYLLADEVGLGKTIEAGVILRQFLLDKPKGNAYVIVPKHLVQQWDDELTTKILTGMNTSKVVLIGSDDLQTVREIDRRSIGLLIVDEAQHISAKSHSMDETDLEEYGLYEEISFHAERLLLLSATPVLNNEQDFLGMLHLLDPENYKLKDFESFYLKVTKRQEIGRLLMSLREGAHPVAIKSSLRRLKQIYEQDPILQSLTQHLEDYILASKNDKDTLNKMIRDIRVHLSETYRLHRRMLRNRRESIQKFLKISRHNPLDQAIILEEDIDERYIEIQSLLDEWRYNANFNSENLTSNTLRSDELVNLFKVLIEASGSWLGTLKKFVGIRLAGSLPDKFVDKYEQEISKLLLEVPLFNGEDELLRLILGVTKQDEADQRLNQLVEILESHHVTHKKCIVFTNFGFTAAKLTTILSEKFGLEAVSSHLSQDEENQTMNLTNFRTHKKCFILVCDRSAEEGLNLQYVDVVIHFDLPLSPNRLEQRIGRLDRIGRKSELISHVFASDHSHDFTNAWFHVLNEGFGIFKNSIASLQFYVDEKLPQILKVTFNEGASSLRDLAPDISQEIEGELVKIGEQQVLDEIDIMDINSNLYLKSLTELENSWTDLEKQSEGWIKEALKFNSSSESSSTLKKYVMNNRTMIPGDIAPKVKTLLSSPGSYNRDVVLNYPTSVLFRLGNPFIDLLHSYVKWDDRGKAFAIWRYESTWPSREGMEWIGFRFDYIVESNTKVAQKIFRDRAIDRSDKHAFLRQADAFFPPFVVTLFINSSLEIETDHKTLQTLNLPHDKRGQDTNLTKHRLHIINELVSETRWEPFCREAQSASINVLKTMPIFTETVNQGIENADKFYSSRLTQLRLRDLREQIGEMCGKDVNLELETQLANAISEGIKNPNILLDSIGFVVISGRKLQVPEMQED